MRIHTPRRRLVLLHRYVVILPLLLLVSSTPSTAQHEASERKAPPRAYSTAPVSDAAAWRDDLRTLVHELDRLHPDPYNRTSETRFDAAVAVLDDAIPRLAAHEIIVELARLVALVGDGHTSLPLHFAPGVDFHVLPYRLGIYEGGIFVEAADRAYADLVGGEVVSIGGVPAQVALARVAPLISRDNDNWIAATAPNLLNRIEVLHALGLSSGLEHADVTVRKDDVLHTERVQPLQELPPTTYGLPFLQQLTDDWVDVRDAADAPVPPYQRRFEDVYWWEYLPSDDLLYIKWDQVQNRRHGPTALATFREAMTFAREQQPTRTVIDIRNNTGGEGGLLPPIIREIVRTREVDESGKLFLVIGRRTFSAGQMMTSHLEMFSEAILVGEPSSARYNGYAGHRMAKLPNAGITFMISPDYYQMGSFPGDSRQQSTPQLAAIPTFEDYRSNRDPALEVIRNYEPDALEEDVMRFLAAGAAARAAAEVRAYDERPVNRFAASSAELNALGYRLLNEGRSEEALAVFRLNVHVHPRYVNGWDSLGEAYVRAHRRAEALAAFRRALTIHPNYPPSLEWLRKLESNP